MVLSLQELMSTLFQETDRAQRMKMPLALIKVGLVCSSDQPDPAFAPEFVPAFVPAFALALQQVLERVTGLLRSYDSVGQIDDNEFLLVLPGCSIPDAMTLAHRLRDEVFGAPLAGAPASTPLQACYGVASSGGRSPVVVLRETDRALQSARAAGAGSIQSAAAPTDIDTAAFLLPMLGDEGLRW